MSQSTELAPIQIGDLLIQPEDLVAIVQRYVRSGDIEEVAELLDLDPADVAIIVEDPEIVSKAVEAKRQLLRLMVYGPLSDAMVSMVGTGDSRSRVAAFKVLKEMADAPPPKPETDDDKPEKSSQAPTVNLAVLVGGGFDAAVAQLDGVVGSRANELAGYIEAEVIPEEDDEEP